MLDKSMSHKYIDGARLVKREMSAKHTPWNQEMTKLHKKPTIQREKERHNKLFLSLEGEWLTRGQGIPLMEKACDKNANSCPFAGKIAISMKLRMREGFSITWKANLSMRAYRGTIRRTRVATPICLTTLHLFHIDPTPKISTHWRFELSGVHATTP